MGGCDGSDKDLTFAKSRCKIGLILFHRSFSESEADCEDYEQKFADARQILGDTKG